MKPNFTLIEVPKISAFGHFSTRTYVNMRFATFYHSGVGLSVNFLIFFSAWVISCLKMHFRLKHFVIYSMGIKTALKFETCLVSSFFVSLNFIKIACFLLHHLWTPILSQLIHPICKQGEALNLFPAFEVLRFFYLTNCGELKVNSFYILTFGSKKGCMLAGWHNLRGVLTSWLDPEFGPQNAYVEILTTFTTKMP